MLYKHLFSILCGHLNLNKKRKNLNLIGYQSNRPVTIQTGRYTGQTGRYTGQTDRYTGRNRLNGEVWIQIWIPPVPTGNRPNRTGIPEPEAGGYRSPVGIQNPAYHRRFRQTPKTVRPAGRKIPRTSGWGGCPPGIVGGADAVNGYLGNNVRPCVSGCFGCS